MTCIFSGCSSLPHLWNQGVSWIFAKFSSNSSDLCFQEPGPICVFFLLDSFFTCFNLLCQGGQTLLTESRLKELGLCPCVAWRRRDGGRRLQVSQSKLTVVLLAIVRSSSRWLNSDLSCCAWYLYFWKWLATLLGNKVANSKSPL